ncbi:MAG: hypothetical protein Phyf2KO_00140 [Phycisphaerales bacterium]
MGGDSRHHTRRKTALYALGLFGSLLAVAMWGKMRFVTDMPRVAYAVPEGQKVTGDDACCTAAEGEGAGQKADEEREPVEDEVLESPDPQSGDN